MLIQVLKRFSWCSLHLSLPSLVTVISGRSRLKIHVWKFGPNLRKLSQFKLGYIPVNIELNGILSIDTYNCDGVNINYIFYRAEQWAGFRQSETAENEPVWRINFWLRLTLEAPIRRKNFFFLSSSPRSTPSQLLAEWICTNKHLILASGYMFIV